MVQAPIFVKPMGELIVTENGILAGQEVLILLWMDEGPSSKSHDPLYNHYTSDRLSQVLLPVQADVTILWSVDHNWRAVDSVFIFVSTKNKGVKWLFCCNEFYELFQ